MLSWFHSIGISLQRKHGSMARWDEPWASTHRILRGTLGGTFGVNRWPRAPIVEPVSYRPRLIVPVVCWSSCCISEHAVHGDARLHLPLAARRCSSTLASWCKFIAAASHTIGARVERSSSRLLGPYIPDRGGNVPRGPAIRANHGWPHAENASLLLLFCICGRLLSQ